LIKKTLFYFKWLYYFFATTHQLAEKLNNKMNNCNNLFNYDYKNYEAALK